MSDFNNVMAHYLRRWIEQEKQKAQDCLKRIGHYQKLLERIEKEQVQP